MNDYHEPANELSPKTRNFTRALNSLKEEIEAIDWYGQREDVCEDDQLRGVLRHNKEEEIEHAAMTLEWLRRNMEGWDEQLRTYLFSEGDITKLEAEDAAAKAEMKIGIGKIK